MGPSLGISVLLLCSTLLLVAATEHVLTLDGSNFDEAIRKHDFVLAEFYAPWCGHCKSLAPEYEKAAKALKDSGSDIVLAKVNADEEKNKALASKYGVQGFPTLKIFRKDAPPQDYNGPREADGIVAYVKKQAGPASLELTSAEVAKAFFEENADAAIVGVFKDLESDEYTTFVEAANKLRSDYALAHTTDASLLPEKGTPVTAPVIRLFKNFGEGFNDLTTFDVDEIKSFAEEKSVPLVVEMTKDPKDRNKLMKVFESPLNKVLLFLDYQGEDAEELKEAYNKVAAANTKSLKFIIGSASENDHALQYFGVAITEIPTIIVHDQSSEKKYVDTEIEAEDVAKFIDDYLAGKLEPRVKSEAIPEDNSGPVKVLVGKNFDDLVVNAKKNVLIEFYAPWCGHCKTLAPIYEEVGKEFANDPTVTIAKMDATANDLTNKAFDVKGFPTLYFYSASGKVVSYEGGRTKKDLVAFVKKNKEDVPEETEEEKAEAKESALEDDDIPDVESKDEL
eukprot:jgi/Mesen1/7784/ME000408S06890